MKKVTTTKQHRLFIAASVFAFSYFASAQTLEQKFENLQLQVENLKLRVSNLETGHGGGNGEGSVFQLTSAVDSECLQRKYAAIPGYPTFDQAISWTTSCRNLPIEQTGCRLMSRSSDQDCYNKIYRMVQGNFSESQVEATDQSCKKYVYNCKP